MVLHDSGVRTNAAHEDPANTVEEIRHLSSSDLDPLTSMGIATVESDLFLLVRHRYRATELFRKAKLVKVPLEAFDSSLKKWPIVKIRSHSAHELNSAHLFGSLRIEIPAICSAVFCSLAMNRRGFFRFEKSKKIKCILAGLKLTR